jgi:hypothetical protein
VGSPETPGVVSADRKPDDVEHEVQQDHKRREVEDESEVFG